VAFDKLGVRISVKGLGDAQTAEGIGESHNENGEHKQEHQHTPHDLFDAVY